MTTTPYSSSLQFLHSMRELVFLKQALTEGLMLTEHEVKFKPISDDTEFTRALNQYVFPKIERQLNRLGLTWDELPEDRKHILAMGVGTISGKVPMLCFTEIPEGRVLATHHLGFGGYGIVVKRHWLDKNRADRVMYFGENSPATWAIYCNLLNAKIPTIHTNKDGLVLWGQSVEEMEHVWNLLSYVQVRHHLDELEWRIVGNHGFLGGERARGKRLPIGIDDIDYVFVQKDNEVADMKEFVEKLAIAQGVSHRPEVLSQPQTLPAKN